MGGKKGEGGCTCGEVVGCNDKRRRVVKEREGKKG